MADKSELSLLKQKVPIQTLNEFSFQQIPDLVRIEKYPGGQQLFKAGDRDNTSIYLLDGEVELISEEGDHIAVDAGSESARYPLSNLKPRRFTAVTGKAGGKVVTINSESLDKLVTWSQMTMGGHFDDGIALEDFDAGESWIARMFQSKQFLRLPSANIEELLSSLEEIEATTGTRIIRQGDPGDYFYFIASGTVKVSRETATGELKLAELRTGDSFGEEALLSNAPRNANVIAQSDCVLKRLSQPDFQRLLREPLLNHTSAEDALKLVRQQRAVVVDVRTEEECSNNGLKGAINLPLYLLRLRIPKLRRDIQYICYCDTEVRSSAAAFLMNRYDLHATILKGGLSGLGS
jgi:CRP-like cAMP-binding protein